jgi:recombination associated protein RdgC
MSFKNARIFQLPENFSIDHKQLSERLSDNAIKPCGPQDSISNGWASPWNNNNELYSLSSGNAQLITMATEKKVIPSGTVNKKLNDKIRLVEKETGSKPTSKHKSELKQEVLFDILPKALSTYKKTGAYFDSENKLLIVESPSQGQAENLVTELRQTLGSFKAKAFGPSSFMSSEMTKWVTDDEPADNFEFGSSLLLDTLDEAKSVIRAKNIFYVNDDIQKLITDNGYFVTEMALVFNERIEFTLTHEFALKGIKFTDIVIDEFNNENIESEEQMIDAKFALMSLELKELYSELLKIFPMDEY